MFRNLARISMVLLIWGAGVLQAQKQLPNQSHGNIQATPEWERIREGLRKARPMPDPQHPLMLNTKTPHGDLIRFDPRTGGTSNLPSADVPTSLGVDRNDGNPGAKPIPVQGGSHSKIAAGRAEGASKAGTSGANIKFGATAPSPFYYPYSYPWNTVSRMLGRWNVAGVDYFWLCSASTASDFHVISAGHCVYNHDPTNDGSGTGAGFANEMWVWSAETDVVDPIDPTNWPDYPYGVAKATLFTTYNAWIGSSDLNWDFSFITLDRRLGDHVGWMGREWGTTTSSLNFDGYPAEAPYVPSNNPYQYPGYDANNVIGYTCCRIQMNAYTYGGHSGGPDWRFDGTNRYVEGVNSTSDRVGYAEATLLTSQIETDLENTIAADQGARPPTDLAQVIEWVFDTTSKGLGQPSTQIGYTFPMTINSFNAGYVDAGDTTADIYLTSDPNNITGGTYIETYDFGYLGTYSYTVQNPNITIPTYVSPGTFYVGYVLNAANPQYNTDNNSVVITNQTMTTYCNADVYEPDNSYTQASLLSSGSIQNHTICAQTDQDWVRFTVTQTSAATLSTEGFAGGDTTMTLYNSSLVQVDYNDDNGIDYYSTINRTCASNPLTPGTYYVLTQSYANATIIPNYTLSLNTTVCPVTTATALTSSLNPATLGQSVTFTATVTSGSGTPTGSVTFKDGASTLGSATLSSGKASFSTTALAVGAHSITAVYAGSSPYTGSTSAALGETVNKAASTTTAKSSLSPSTYGIVVTFTATVKSTTTGTPTGTLVFKDGATTLGSAALSGGSAVFSTSTLGAGSHSITAVYSGDSNFTGSTSAALSEPVNRAASSTTVASSLNPSSFGVSVTFTATPKSSTSGNPTGAITFKDGAAAIGTATISGGVAKMTTSTLAVAGHSITAVYNGDLNFTGSTSAVLKQTVNKAGTASTVTSSLNPSKHGTAVTFTASIKSLTTGTPTGSVAFKDGTTTLGNGTLSGGKATLATSALAAGSHSITVVYAGDTSFLGSTSPALVQTVTP
jgi:hypothetical protein